MRYLGLDLGTKTLGVSISDITHTIANSYKTICFKENDFEAAIHELEKIIKEFEIKKIVLGLPKNMNNSMGTRALSTLEFKNLIEQKFQIPVIMQDERLTTVEATNYMIEADMSRRKRKTKVDALAASIILQTYLDRRKED